MPLGLVSSGLHSPRLTVKGEKRTMPKDRKQQYTCPICQDPIEDSFTNNLIQLVSEPTHVRGNVLDLCITNAPYLLSNLAVDQSTCSSQSDHHLLTLNILSTSTHKQVTESPLRKSLLNYSKADIPSIEEYLLNSSIVGSTPHIKDVNTVWPLIKREILNACYKFTPTAKIPTNPSPKWFDSRIRHQINRIRTLRRHTTKILSAFHEQPRKLFSYFKDLSKSKFIPKFIIHNDVPIYDPGKIANLFNTFFNSTFTSSNYILPAFDALPSPSNQLLHIDISSLDVYKALSDLDPTKAFGCDNVHPRVLKHCAVALTEPITHLCDLSIKNQCIPDEWKLHKICPIPKKR